MYIDFLPLSDDVKFPVYATKGAAGMDLYANNFKLYYPSSQNPPVTEFGDLKTIQIQPRSRLLVGLGFKVAIPDGFEMQIRPRSGLALKKGITVLNAPGTIDSDYRGEVGVILVNHGSEMVDITKGDAIAQAIIAEYQPFGLNLVKELSDTKRGEGGFGSTTKETKK